ncbi:RDD family protein [compost metagenome]
MFHSWQLQGAYWISTALYFVLLPCCTGGRTFGKWVVRIRISSQNGHSRLGGLIIRYLLLYGILIGANVFLITSSLLSSPPSPWTGIPYSLVMLLDFVFFVHLIIRVFKRNPVLVYEQLSKTHNQITWPDKQGASSDNILQDSI